MHFGKLKRGLACAVAWGLAVSGVAAEEKMDTEMAPIVEISSGKVAGVIDGDVQSFKGIPFAAPPIGENRWRAPQPVKPWAETLVASDFKADCMQKPFPSDAAPLGKTPAEDCLGINVWAPKGAKAGDKLPVMVWIYGGGFVNGGSSPKVYDGSAFAESGVVLVSFNYRIGRFGFFAHPALSAAKEGLLGNYGYMDQIAALQWVKRNVAAFGGDAGNVTIFGESAGGASVHTLLGTPLARGLFHKAIVMSGGGRNLMGSRSLDQDMPARPSAETIGMNFAEKHGITGKGPDALKALRALSAEDVTDGLNLMAFFTPQKGKPTYAGPIADGRIIVGEAGALLAAGKVAKVPFMSGPTSQDIGFLYAPTKEALFAKFGDNADRAKQVYDPKGDMPLNVLSMMIGADQNMQEPARYAVDKMHSLGQPSYHYRFSYVAESIRDGQGAQHASEIPFFFKTIDEKYGDKVTEKDWQTSSAAHDYFVNFAKNGSPSGLGGLPNWAPYDPAQDTMMNFSMDQGAVHGVDPWKERLDLVEQLAQPY